MDGYVVPHFYGWLRVSESLLMALEVGILPTADLEELFGSRSADLLVEEVHEQYLRMDGLPILCDDVQVQDEPQLG